MGIFPSQRLRAVVNILHRRYLPRVVQTGCQPDQQPEYKVVECWPTNEAHTLWAQSPGLMLALVFVIVTGHAVIELQPWGQDKSHRLKRLSLATRCYAEGGGRTHTP